MNTVGTQELSYVNETVEGFADFPGRVSAIASSPNKLFVGTVQGDIYVKNKHSGAPMERVWTQSEGAIEGLIYDSQGRIIYATSWNLVILDRELKHKVKEFWAGNRISKISKNKLSTHPSHREEDDPVVRPPHNLVVGRKEPYHEDRPRYVHCGPEFDGLRDCWSQISDL